MVKNIDGRPLQFEPDSFSEPDSLGNTQVKVKVIRTTQGVDREIAESAWSRSGHQTRLQGCRSHLARSSTAGAEGQVKQIRIHKEHAGWRLEEPNVLLELFIGDTNQLRADVRRS